SPETPKVSLVLTRYFARGSGLVTKNPFGLLGSFNWRPPRSITLRPLAPAAANAAPPELAETAVLALIAPIPPDFAVLRFFSPPKTPLVKPPSRVPLKASIESAATPLSAAVVMASIVEPVVEPRFSRVPTLLTLTFAA